MGKSTKENRETLPPAACVVNSSIDAEIFA